MNKRIFILLTLPLLWLLSSCSQCSDDQTQILQRATGAVSEVIVVLEKDVIEESIGLTLKEILMDEYPMIPQSEPLFNVAMIPSANFSHIFKSHRNLVIISIDKNQQEPKIEFRKDVWAAPQTVISISGPTYPAIEKLVVADKERLVQLIEQSERDRFMRQVKKDHSASLQKFAEEKFGLSMYFPKGYALNLDTTDFAWISYETTKTSQGIFIYQYPYVDNNTFTSEYLVEKRNDFIHRFVPGPTGNSYMSTETLIPPTFKSLRFDGRYFGQLRGLWTVIGHPMGGPFISLTTIDEENNMVITIEGYVFAPGLNKRNFIRQVDAILLSAKVNDTPQKE